MVVQDPKHRQAIKGFINFALIISARSAAAGTLGGSFSGSMTQEVNALVNAVNEYTGLQARFIGQIAYDDSRLMDVPIVFANGVPNESEMEHLARYLIGGGFMFRWLPLATEALEKYGGLVAGQDFWTQRLALEHPIFTSFFDVRGIPSGLPPNALGNLKDSIGNWFYAEGYFIKGRMAGIAFSTDFGWTNQTYDGDSTRQLQMAVNVIVYALTQEGSITQRLMQMVD